MARTGVGCSARYASTVWRSPPRRTVAVLPLHVVGAGEYIASPVAQEVGRIVAGDGIERHRGRDGLGVGPCKAGERTLSVQDAAVVLEHLGQHVRELRTQNLDG
jgi:hypothetical protein